MIKKSLLVMVLALVSACCMAQNTSEMNVLLTPEIGGIKQAIDIQTATAITTAYFEQLNAPRKALFLFDHSGHQIHKDEPEKFQNTIISIVDTATAEP